ncbi:MAG TPA: hypothetical protein VL475_08450 [Planctomycetaceae bacterium]|nr:hypothetical protein [Planctomycetaceae bacterium]
MMPPQSDKPPLKPAIPGRSTASRPELSNWSVLSLVLGVGSPLFLCVCFLSFPV